MQTLNYMRGFGNEFHSTAPGYEDAIPWNGVNPQECPHQLYAEQLSGSAFTAPRHSNKRSWFYRCKPSVMHSPYRPFPSPKMDYSNGQIDPSQRRWKPFEVDSTGNNFVEGMHLLAFSDQSASSAISIFVYLADTNMDMTSFSNSDGDLLIVPQNFALSIRTEFGRMVVEPNEIAVIQQGMRFSVDVQTVAGQAARGYILEVRGNHFELPHLGPIGANGLANPRDFLVPMANVEFNHLDKPHTLLLKFQNRLFHATQLGSPFDVAGWFGNYAPYKYNLDSFVSMNSVSIDHPDPSIFTVLTCPSHGRPGTALADFVIFPPRWECANNTFRPPYYHRNCMTEFMGLIKGQYQAKTAAFAPGGASLHQSMIPHGPDRDCYSNAVAAETGIPRRVADDTMAFMFETSLPLQLTKWACENNVDDDYYKCWEGLKPRVLEERLIP